MELKKIKKNLEATKHSKQEKPNDSEPEFKFGRNKKQYKLNRNMLDKMGSAMATSDDKVGNNLFQEGEALLKEQNKHICLADKYGWDTVKCYIVKLVASHYSEKPIKNAIKESKLLREEKRIGRSKVESYEICPERGNVEVCSSRKTLQPIFSRKVFLESVM